MPPESAGGHRLEPDDPHGESAARQRNDAGNIAPAPVPIDSAAPENSTGCDGAKGVDALEEARAALARGWALTPLKGKVPKLKGWPSLPKPSLDEVVAWARSHNLGLRTGVVSGVVVVDDDTPDGAAAEKLALPKTVTVRTGSGRLHHYFKVPRERIGNSESRLAKQVDVKGEGGQVVFVGSIHPDTGNPYEWEPGLSPDEVELAEFPAHLIGLLREPHTNGSKSKTPSRLRAPHRRRAVAYAHRALERVASELPAVPEGTRNDALNKSAFALGRFVGAGLLDRAEVEAALDPAARQAGLASGEIAATLRSGLDAGASEPFDVEYLAERFEGEKEASRRSASESFSQDGRPTIIVDGGRLPGIVDEAETAWIALDGVRAFQRGGMLVRIVRPAHIDAGSVGLAPISTLVPIELAHLVERFTAAAHFLKLDGRSGEFRAIDCPERVATTYLARRGAWKLRELRAIVPAPTLRADGSILQAPGYDNASALFFEPGESIFPPIPEHPSREDALSALGRLDELIRDFPFVAESDRSTALAAILTALVRYSLRSAPLFAYRAPKMSSGKSLLADVTARIATGRPAAMMSAGSNEDEERKRMLALLVEGAPVICLDNVDRPLGSGPMCTVLTEEVWKDRVLGHTATATVPTTATWLATGNNLVFTGDITTRVLPCDIDPRCERPEERHFDVDLRQYVTAHRGELVAAGLTVLRAYVAAGEPSKDLVPFGRFEQWSRRVREPLVWLGRADPCDGRRRLEAHDPIRSQLRAVLISWDARYGAEVLTVARLIGAMADLRDDPLRLALLDVAANPGTSEINSQRLGKWLQRHALRIESGLRLERMEDHQGVAQWRVTRG